MTPVPQASAATLFSALRQGLFRYYNTPFGLADQAIQAERTVLLDQDQVTWRPPWIEVIHPYVAASHPISKSCSEAGAPASLATFASLGLLHGIDRLYQHQEDALTAALHGRNVVLTVGTGSGKTEALFLPVIARLLAESESWEPGASMGNSWWAGDGGWQAQRTGEKGRQPRYPRLSFSTR